VQVQKPAISIYHCNKQHGVIVVFVTPPFVAKLARWALNGDESAINSPNATWHVPSTQHILKPFGHDLHMLGRGGK